MRRRDRGPSRRERKKEDQARPAPHNCEAVMRIRRLSSLMQARMAVGQQHILIGEVVKILDPEGKYVPPLPPGADPVFGTLPVTAPEKPEDPQP